VIKIDPFSIIPVDLYQAYTELVVNEQSRHTNASRTEFVREFIDLGASSFFTSNIRRLTHDEFIRKVTRVSRP
jgi:hypothetical protein